MQYEGEEDSKEDEKRGRMRITGMDTRENDKVVRRLMEKSKRRKNEEE